MQRGKLPRSAVHNAAVNEIAEIPAKAQGAIPQLARHRLAVVASKLDQHFARAENENREGTKRETPDHK
jgi:hypothetical protein